VEGEQTRATAAIGLLDDEVRRALYEAVVARRSAVSRDDAAHAVGISRNLAAYHLDRLEAAGLLSVEYRRPEGRSGPGAGRPSKLYRRSDRQIDVSHPPRRYELAARILLRGLSGAEADTSSVERAAGEAGKDLGAEGLDLALAHCGFEAATDEGTTLLCNCPFLALTKENQELTCRLNHAFVQGILKGAGRGDLRAVLQPDDEVCCVRLVPSKSD